MAGTPIPPGSCDCRITARRAGRRWRWMEGEERRGMEGEEGRKEMEWRRGKGRKEDKSREISRGLRGV